MKKSTQLRIITIVLLVGLAVVDAIAFVVPIAAIIGIILFLFRPKWLLTFIEKIYDKHPSVS